MRGGPFEVKQPSAIRAEARVSSFSGPASQSQRIPPADGLLKNVLPASAIGVEKHSLALSVPSGRPVGPLLERKAPGIRQARGIFITHRAVTGDRVTPAGTQGGLFWQQRARPETSRLTRETTVVQKLFYQSLTVYYVNQKIRCEVGACLKKGRSPDGLVHHISSHSSQARPAPR